MGRQPEALFVALGLFLKDRDLGLLFLFAEMMAKAKDRAERQHRQQELKKAFHRNLPFLIL
jgi:hypothetical protein